MSTNAIQQAVVVKRKNLNPNQTSTQLALFNLDGTPFESGPGGSCDCDEKTEALEERVSALEGLLAAGEGEETPESTDN